MSTDSERAHEAHNDLATVDVLRRYVELGISDRAIEAIASAIEAARAEERETIMNLLGYDANGEGLRSVEQLHGQEVNICNDPFYELEGALIDLERTGADKICIATVRRIQARIADVSKYARAGSQNKQPAQMPSSP